MRLIDADTLKDTLLKHRYTTEHNQIFRYIDEQPTAYYEDKNNEKLELHSFELGTDTLPVHYVRLNDAIEIVKQGGVSNWVGKEDKGGGVNEV